MKRRAAVIAAIASIALSAEASAQRRARPQRATRATAATASAPRAEESSDRSCAVLGEPVLCANARAVSGLQASAHLIPNALTSEVARAITANANAAARGALVSEVIRRVQSMPYARGTQAPATIAGLALAQGAAAMDCDERSYVAASVINALAEPERVVEVSPGVRVAVARAAVVNVPRIKHAVLLLELSERPRGYTGPLALVGGSMYAPVECTAVLAVGEFDRERDAVLRDPAADTTVTRVIATTVIDMPVRGPFRGHIARASESAEGFRWAEAVTGQAAR
jgi:hypothetical protein